MNLDENYQNLANAIILQAVEDYREARRIQAKPNRRKKKQETIGGKTPEQTVNECSAFFRSDWFDVLSEASGPAILHRLEKEFEKENTQEEIT